MSKNSLQSLSQKLAVRQQTDQERIERETTNALQLHAENLSDASRAGQRSISDATARLTNQVRNWEDQITEAQRATAETTARVMAQHQERIEAAASEAQERAKRVLKLSAISLAVVWGLAIAGLLVALGASWWAHRAASELMALEATKSALERLQGVQVIQAEGRTVISAPRLSVTQTGPDGRMYVDVE